MDREKERVWEREKGEIKKNKDNAYKKNDFIQYKWPMAGQYTFELTKDIMPKPVQTWIIIKQLRY